MSVDVLEGTDHKEHHMFNRAKTKLTLLAMSATVTTALWLPAIAEAGRRLP